MISLSCQCLVRFGIVAWYQINKDYISQNLCENRDKPQMKCCGKCYLKKKLAKVDESSNNGKQEQSKSDKAEQFDCIIPQKVTINKIYFVEKQIHFVVMPTFYFHRYFHSIFHPPSVSC